VSTILHSRGTIFRARVAGSPPEKNTGIKKKALRVSRPAALFRNGPWRGTFDFVVREARSTLKALCLSDIGSP